MAASGKGGKGKSGGKNSVGQRVIDYSSVPF